MLLSMALRGNAAFTALCALISIIGADWVTFHTALPARTWATGLGLLLAAYVPVLLFAASRPFSRLVITVIVLDWGYVAIAISFLLTHLGEADSAGLGLITLSTAFVAFFAWLQLRGLAAMRREACA